ncbi:hypothetical protein N9Z94_02535 [Akkermansiaceae bacterium]|nr:hypothetical protein [Akkermansiaceae bacterium]MDC1206161.1 hypothetical protein [Akkermansiaceae bacterium]
MSKLRKLRTGLNLVIVILLTLLGRHFYEGWRAQGLAEEIVSACGLPVLPPELDVITASRDGNDVALSVTGPDKEFDAWLGEVDEWKAGRPTKVLNFSIRESEGSLRMDFTAEIRP